MISSVPNTTLSDPCLSTGQLPTVLKHIYSSNIVPQLILLKISLNHLPQTDRQPLGVIIEEFGTFANFK